VRPAPRLLPTDRWPWTACPTAADTPARASAGLPADLQCAQMDSGQKSGIAHATHAPSARPSALAPAQRLVARDSMHNNGSHTAWSKRAAPVCMRTRVLCASFPALPSDAAPTQIATARRPGRTDAYRSRRAGRSMRARPYWMPLLAFFITLCTIAISVVANKSSVSCMPRWPPSRQGWNVPASLEGRSIASSAVANKSSVPGKPRWLPSRQDWYVPVSLEGRSGATHYPWNPGTHTQHNRSLGHQSDSPLGLPCPSHPQIGMTFSSRRSSALFPLPDLSLWQCAPLDTESLAADQSYLCGFLASHDFGDWPPSAPLDPLGATDAWKLERDRFARYDTVICTNDQRRMCFNIWDINYNRCPGHHFSPPHPQPTPSLASLKTHIVRSAKAPSTKKKCSCVTPATPDGISTVLSHPSWWSLCRAGHAPCAQPPPPPPSPPDDRSTSPLPF